MNSKNDLTVGKGVNAMNEAQEFNRICKLMTGSRRLSAYNKTPKHNWARQRYIECADTLSEVIAMRAVSLLLNNLYD